MDYVEHVSRKFCTAVAFAVLKNKPPEMPTQEYVLQLQHQIKSSMHNQAMDIDDISITSLDFDDVIEDTLATPKDYGILTNVNTINREKHSKNSKDVCQIPNTVDVSNTEIEDGQLDVTYVNNDDLTINVDVGPECGQMFDDYGPIERNVAEVDVVSGERIGESNGHVTRESQDSKSIAKDNEENREQFTNFNFGQSQPDLFLTQSQVDFSLPKNTDNMDLQSNEQTAYHKEIDSMIENTTVEPMVFTNNSEAVTFSETPKLSNQIIPPYLQEQIVLPMEAKKVMPLQTQAATILEIQSCIKSQTQNITAPIQFQENIVVESEKELPLETQNPCMDLLSQAIDSKDIEGTLSMQEAHYIDLNGEAVERGVSFKVVQDLGHVKDFLRLAESKRNGSIGNSLQDSGYRSDGQLSASQLEVKTATHLHSTALNQSAETLIGHLATCPAVSLQHGVAREAAAALARLARAARSRHSCPGYADRLLDAVAGMVEALEGGELLKNEEITLRLTLLSESIDVTEYTIDKLLDRLESFHKALFSDPDTPREATNIADVESQCYLLHTLETLISSYLSKKERDSVEEEIDEGSQDGTPAPTPISDIWRKRWDPDFKPVRIKTTKMKEKCNTVERCGALLNKFIVDCMEGYSLISFAALECFNCLQP